MPNTIDHTQQGSSVWRVQGIMHHALVTVLTLWHSSGCASSLHSSVMQYRTSNVYRFNIDEENGKIDITFSVIIE